MNRPAAYSAWLLADVSLDRAAGVLPILGFPEQHAVVQQCIDALGHMVAPALTDAAALGNALRQLLEARLGERRHCVERWLDTFPFTSESVDRALFYWDRQFDDLLCLDKAPAPPAVTAEAWNALICAYHGDAPDTDSPWSAALREAAAARRTVFAAVDAIEAARAAPLSAHDLDIYSRFGWDDQASQQGLSSLEIGARLSATRQFWKAVAGYVPAAAMEAMAYQRDIDDWRKAPGPSAFSVDAERYDVAGGQMATDIFPEPAPPPGLKDLLEQ